MSSDVSIVNRALARVGQGPIVNLSEGSRLARVAQQWYEPSRDELLRDYRWKFAIKRASLPALAQAPVYGYTYAYQIPGDCLRVLSVNDLDPEYDPDLDPTLWDREGDTIVTNERPEIKVRYIRRVTDPASFDESFSAALVALLAWRFSPSLRELETDLPQVLESEYQRALMTARSRNAIEARPRVRKRTRSYWAETPRWGGW